MEHPPQAEFPVMGAAPPTRPGTLGPRRTTWPSVLGIITIILGSLGMLSGLWTAVTPLFADVLAGIVPGGMTGMESVTKYAWLMVALGVSTLVRGGLETWAGVELYRRRARAATLMRAWAALAIVLAFVGAISTYLMQLEQFRVMGEKQGTAVPAGLGDVVGVISGIVALAWGCLFPVFTLIWFARASIRQEVRSWAAGAST